MKSSSRVRDHLLQAALWLASGASREKVAGALLAALRALDELEAS